MTVFLDALQKFITDYQVIIISLGVPLMTVFATWFVSAQTNRTARRLAEKERRQNVQLKLAEFRQAWINDLRNELARYSSLTLSSRGKSFSDAELQNIVEVGSRIMMRVNSQDPDVELLKAALSAALPSSGNEVEEKEALSVTEIGRRMLKREWERLKADLAEIDGGRN